MSHDIEAAWAGSELATKCSLEPELFFDTPPDISHISAYAAIEGRNSWPHADGVIEISVTGGASNKIYNLAIEYKRPNEGLHGILTAIGQAHAYLHKGYSGSVIVIPEAYDTLSNSGGYVKEVLDNTSRNPAIGVFTYSKPDPLKSSPFSGILNQVRSLSLDSLPSTGTSHKIEKTKTQWAHLREGSSDADAFFRYLQCLKYQSGDRPPPNSVVVIPPKLIDAVRRIDPRKDPFHYLSSTSGEDLASRTWRHFWFSYVLFAEMMIPWKKVGKSYQVNHQVSKIRRLDNGEFKKFFSGRTDSNKEISVEHLNNRTWSENEAWDYMAKKFHDRAHSYREDIDSGLAYIEFIDEEGRMTPDGYRFLDACEKSSDPNVGFPRTLLLSALLQAGGLAGFLHYIYRLSEQKFSLDPFAFAQLNSRGYPCGFGHEEYLIWLEDEMTNKLRVMRKVSTRGGTARKPFQAELAILRNYNIVGKKFRIGVGLPINWPEIQRITEFVQ